MTSLLLTEIHSLQVICTPHPMSTPHPPLFFLWILGPFCIFSFYVIPPEDSLRPTTISGGNPPVNRPLAGERLDINPEPLGQRSGALPMSHRNVLLSHYLPSMPPRLPFSSLCILHLAFLYVFPAAVSNILSTTSSPLMSLSSKGTTSMTHLSQNFSFISSHTSNPFL